MKYLVNIIVFILSVSSSYSQEKEKPVYYYDINNLEISKEIFIKKRTYAENKPRYLSLYFENDTAFIAKLHPRKKYGRLTKNEFISIKDFLKLSDIPNNKDYTLIHYHPGRDRCNGGRSYHTSNSRNGIYSRWYLRKLVKNYNYNIFWTHKKDDSMEFKSRGPIIWKVDNNQVIQKQFFKYHFPCNSFVIINNKTKHYISVYGESGSMAVMKIADEMEEMNNKSN